MLVRCADVPECEQVSIPAGMAHGLIRPPRKSEAPMDRYDLIAGLVGAFCGIATAFSLATLLEAFL